MMTTASDHVAEIIEKFSTPFSRWQPAKITKKEILSDE